MIFNTLSIVATLALGAFTSAIPLSTGDVNVANVGSVLPAVPVVPDVPALPVRRSSQTVVEIVKATTVNVTYTVTEFKYLTAANATLEVLTPLVLNIKTAIAGAIVEVEALAGGEASDILGLVDGVLVTVTELATVVAELLVLVLEAVSYILSIVTSDIYDCVLILLGDLVEILGCLVICLIMSLGSVVSGLLSALIPLLGDVLSVLGIVESVIFSIVLNVGVKL